MGVFATYRTVTATRLTWVSFAGAVTALASYPFVYHTCTVTCPAWAYFVDNFAIFSEHNRKPASNLCLLLCAGSNAGFLNARSLGVN